MYFDDKINHIYIYIYIYVNLNYIMNKKLIPKLIKIYKNLFQ